MKVTIDITALSTRHSFTGEELSYCLEMELLGHALRVPISPEIVSDIDSYVERSIKKVRTTAPKETHYEERREYPSSYDMGVEYELGEVSLRDMEDL